MLTKYFLATLFLTSFGLTLPAQATCIKAYECNKDECEEAMVCEDSEPAPVSFWAGSFSRSSVNAPDISADAALREKCTGKTVCSYDNGIRKCRRVTVCKQSFSDQALPAFENIAQ